MKRPIRCLSILLIFVSFLLTCKTESPALHFPILAWYGPSANIVNPFDLLGIREAGFNQCFIDLKEGWLNEKALALADSIGLQLYITDRYAERFITGEDSTLRRVDSLTTRYNGHHSFLGCFLYDKPGLKDFAPISTLVDYFNSKHPEDAYFIQAHPIYSSAASLDTLHYDDYLSLFAQKLKPKFLSIEHFSIVKDEIRPEFFANLETMRRVSLDAGIPFWAYAMIVSSNENPVIAHSHVRVQLYSGLAFGAKGVQYYSFRPPQDETHQFGDAMLSREGDRTKSFAFTQAINAEVQQLGPTLMQLHSTGVYFSNPVPAGSPGFKPGLPIIKIDSPAVLTGFFADDMQRKYVMFVNTDFFYGKRAKVHFAENVKRLVEVSKNYMPPLVIEWEDKMYKDADILFKAGDGRLFQIIEN